MNNYIGSIGNSYLQNSTDLAEIENIKRSSKSDKEKLQKTAQEFESIFISKMLTVLDKTVDKENSLFQDSKYMDNFKTIFYNDIARTIAKDPYHNLGIAKQLYTQLEKTIKD